MSKTRQTLGEKLAQVSVVLANIQDATLKASLAKYGYGDARLNELQVIYNEVLGLLEKQDAAIAEKKQASQIRKEAERTAKITFNEHVAIAKRALIGNLGSISDLGISTLRPRNFEMWFKMARSFYTTALGNPSIMSNLLLFNVTQQSLEDGLFLINTIEPLYNIQKDKMGLSQVAKETRDKKLAEMRIWYSDFVIMARMAFRKDPQQLERFGIVKLSPGYHRKKKETPTVPPVVPPTAAKKTDIEFNLDNPAAE